MKLIPALIISAVVSSQPVYANEKNIEMSSQLLQFCLHAMKTNNMEDATNSSGLSITVTRNNTVAQFGEPQDTVSMIAAIKPETNEARCNIYVPEVETVMSTANRILDKSSEFDKKDAPIGFDGKSFLYIDCKDDYVIEVLTNPYLTPDLKKGPNAYQMLGIGTEFSLKKVSNQKGQC